MVDYVLLLMMIMKEIHGLTIVTHRHLYPLISTSIELWETSFDGGG
jgi:hypothetical protein